VLAIPLLATIGRCFLLLTLFSDEPALYNISIGAEDDAKRSITKYYFHDYVHTQYYLLQQQLRCHSHIVPNIVHITQCYFYLSGMLILTMYSPLITMEILKEDYTTQRLAMVILPLVAIVTNMVNIISDKIYDRKVTMIMMY
jgi:hypothetical protein